MVAERSITTVTGVVALVNPKGLRLNGADSWANFSKFASHVTVPERGDHVALGVDGSGFIRTCEVITPGAQDSQVGNALEAAQVNNADRETRITRSASINSAIALLKGGRVKPAVADVLRVAEEIEAWVTR